MDFGVKNIIKSAFSFNTKNIHNSNQQNLQMMTQQFLNKFSGQQSGQSQYSQNQFSQQDMNQQYNQNQFNQNNMSQQYNQQTIGQQGFGGINQGSVGVSLKKGQKVSLSKMNSSLDNIMVGLGWDVNGQYGVTHDLDVEVFMLGDNEKVLGDDWFIFYNKLVSPDGSVIHSGDNTDGEGQGDDEIIMVQLSRVAPQVKKLVFVVSISEAQARGHNFGQVSNAYIRIVDKISNNELVRYNLTDYYSSVISMVVGEVYRHNNEWKFNPVGDGTADDLIGLCNRYGVRLK